MRIEGSLTKWNNDRGYGFIAPVEGGPDVFVHASAFPQDGIRPSLGEKLSFEIEVDPGGKKRAVRLVRYRRAAIRETPRVPPPRAKAGVGLAARLVTLVIMAGLAYYGYSAYARYKAPQQSAAQALVASPGAARFRCDGRTHCAEMHSCDEAYYFLRNCPGVKMDGNRDGVPCEVQWCGGH